MINFTKSNHLKMDLQSEIDWIKNELDKVHDPDFLNALKSMFNYRNKNVSTSSFFSKTNEDMESRAQSSISSVEKGNTRPLKDFKNDLKNGSKK